MGCPRCTCGPRARRLVRVSVLVLGLLLLALARTGALGPAEGALLTLLPALAAFGLMLVRPYLGERGLARLRRRCGRAPRRALSLAAPRPRLERMLACGGHLIASSLAGRAPPHALARGL